MNKIDWDSYFLTLAFVASQRSIDPSTKCGCVIVSKENRVLSMGYNGPIKESIDSNIPLTRPKKYYHFIHSEMNALLAYSGSYQDIQNSKCYVTIRPCHDCLRALLQKGITEIYYSNLPDAKCVDQESIDAQKIMLQNRNVKIVQLPYNNILQVLTLTHDYICNKNIEGK